jgi:hypothetical protein
MAQNEPTLTLDGEWKVIEMDGSTWRLQGEINNSLAQAISLFLSKQDKPVTARQVREIDD